MKYLFPICVSALASAIVISAPVHAQGDVANKSAKAAKSKLNAYRPGGHRCNFLVVDVYSSNQASVNRAERLLDDEFACIRRYMRTEAIKLNAILVLYGGSAKVVNQSAGKTGKLSITWNTGCGCKAELIAARDRIDDAIDKLMVKHNKRVNKFNNILRNGY